MIIISGSSWGAGEWEEGDVSHPGLAQYIVDIGKPVINLSQPGTSSWEFYQVLLNFIKFNKQHIVEKIIIFEDSYLQYYTDLLNYDANAAKMFTEQLSGGIDHFISALSSNFYHRLSALGQKYNVPIVLVGSYTDTLWLEKFSIEYPMVSIGCQSTVNLMLTGDSKISTPVRIVNASSKNIPTIEIIKKNLSVTEIEKFLYYIDLGQKRHHIFEKHPEYFYPDSYHLNRKGHKILFNFLKENFFL